VYIPTEGTCEGPLGVVVVEAGAEDVVELAETVLPEVVIDDIVTVLLELEWLMIAEYS
jgi:hypothetical protein